MILSGKYKDVLFTPSHTYTSSPTSPIPHQTGTFVTSYDSTLTYHYCLKFIVDIRVHYWCCTFYFMGFDTCLMTCIHHCSILYNSFTTLKFLYSAYSSLLLANSAKHCGFFFYSLLSFSFSRM